MTDGIQEHSESSSVHGLVSRCVEQKIPLGTMVRTAAQYGHCSDRKKLQPTVCISAKKTMAIHQTLHPRNSMNGVLSQNTSLGRVCHDGQVAPDRHQATVRKPLKKKPMKIATWNVKTLYQKGKFENVKVEMKRMDINILGLVEIRWTGTGEFKSDDEYKIIYLGGNQHHRGVGIMLSPNIGNTLKGHWPVSDRIIVITLSAKPFDISIIQMYAPTADHDDAEAETFYENLEATLKQLKSTDVKIIMGDFNAKLGASRIGNIVGPHGLGEINERGERLAEWCEENNYTVTNTWYKNHSRRKWTWKSPGDRHRNLIDFILIQSRFRNAIQSAKPMPGADCGSDHVPVICTFNLKLQAQKKSKQQPCYNYKQLKTDKELKDRFALEVRNKFSVLEDVTDVDGQWKQMKDSIKRAIEENIPLKPKKEHKKWMTQEILDKMETRRKAKDDHIKYKLIDKEINKMCNNAKEIWLNDQCEEIERKKTTDSKYMHNKIKDIAGQKSSSQSKCIKSKDGEILMNKTDILKRWAEYIEDLFLMTEVTSE